MIVRFDDDDGDEARSYASSPEVGFWPHQHLAPASNDNLYCNLHFLLAPSGALSRRSDRDNRLPSIPSTYSSDCSKPFYSDLKLTVTVCD